MMEQTFNVRTVDVLPIPIAPTDITGTGTGTAQTVLTCPAGRVTKITGLTVRNTTGTAATVTIHAVPDGGSIGVTNELVPEYNIPANSPLVIHSMIDSVFAPGTTIEVFASTGSALLIWGGAEAWL